MSNYLEEYLLHQCRLLKYYDEKIPKRRLTNSDKYAVLIEPRSDHLLIEAVVRNVMYFLPSDWNLMIFSYDEEYIRKKLPEYEFLFYKLPKNNFNNAEYNSFLKTKKFWEAIPAEHIIIFQTDSYMCRHLTDQEFKTISIYPMIGAVYKYVDIKTNKIDLFSCHSDFSINGGFSYRSKKAMLNCINTINDNDIIKYRIKNNLPIEGFNDFKECIQEDIFYNHALTINGYKLPSSQECMKFCVQTYYQYCNPLAIHGIYKHYVYDKFIYYINPSLENLHAEMIQLLNNHPDARQLLK